MVVAQLRGAEFEMDSKKKGYISTHRGQIVVEIALLDVSSAMRFANVGEYLFEMDKVGRKILERLPLEEGSD